MATTFKPAWWLTHPHGQTIWPTVFRPKIKNLALTRERFELDDGDFVDLDWAGNGNGPIVLLLHGIEGSIHSPYAKGMLVALLQQGLRGVFMHFRSCSGEPNRLARFYHSGDTQDIAEVLQALMQREPATQFAAIGFSLGGNALLKYLGETGDRNRLSAAVAISVPYELSIVASKMNRGFAKLYQWHFLKSLRARLNKKNIVPARMPTTFREFDDDFTAPLHGFLNAEDYYQKSSARQFLSAIQVPTLLLHAKDDPFLTPEVIPLSDELSDKIILEITEKGGHVGFVEGMFPWCASYWLERRVPAFLANYLEKKDGFS